MTPFLSLMDRLVRMAQVDAHPSVIALEPEEYDALVLDLPGTHPVPMPASFRLFAPWGSVRVQRLEPPAVVASPFRG